jgi:phosphodiesterase/alkaline phosphatase D-like protein
MPWRKPKAPRQVTKVYPSCFCFFALALTAFGQSAGPFIGGVWAGNVSPTTVTVSIRLNVTGQRVRLQVSQNESLTPAVFSSIATTAANLGNTVKLTVQGLQPDTDYFYGLEVAGALRQETVSRGRFRTFPIGRASFRSAFGSCSDFRLADQRVFDAIREEHPLLFIHLGDLHYIDTNSTSADDYRLNYDRVLSHPVQGSFYRSVGLAYMWDDHDFAGDNSDGTFVGRDTARAVYRERVPHYSIGPTGGAIGQAFTVGRVRFIMTDLRSTSVSAATRESASKSRMGTAQKNWFKQELVNARDAGFPFIVWINTAPWISGAQLGDDSWGGYTSERTELANFIRDNRIVNLAMLSGDMHGLAFDDGAHADYATGGGAPITVIHAAALSSDPIAKGGPYTVGPILGGQQYGVLDIHDNGGPSVACRFFGTRVGEGRKISQIFSSAPAVASDTAVVNISTMARITSPTDAIVSGFVVAGSSNHSVLIRAVGPTLAAFGVNDALNNPVLSIYQGERLIATNTAWAGDARATVQEITDAFDRTGAFRFTDEATKDCVLLVHLAPGAYTVQVKSGDGASGAALLEIFDLR